MRCPINIVLAFVFLLQTVGCTPLLIQLRQIRFHNTQEQVPVEALRQLKRGMPIMIALREESEIPFKEREIECIIEEVGSESLIVIPRPRYSTIRHPNRFVIYYSDMFSIEYQGWDRALIRRRVLQGLAAAAFISIIYMLINIDIELD